MDRPLSRVTHGTARYRRRAADPAEYSVARSTRRAGWSQTVSDKAQWLPHAPPPRVLGIPRNCVRRLQTRDGTGGILFVSSSHQASSHDPGEPTGVGDVARLAARCEPTASVPPAGCASRRGFLCAPRDEIATALGAVSDENHALRVNSHQQTSVDGLYAAGDIVRGLAAAEAALAATDIHKRLRRAGL
jgi:hypothetical protein